MYPAKWPTLEATMSRRTGSLVAAILAIVSVPTTAQWLNHPTPSIPRTADGKPNLAAPAGRKMLSSFGSCMTSRKYPISHCLPGGPLNILTPGLHRIIQSPTVVALLYEGGSRYRQIFLDGRQLP